MSRNSSLETSDIVSVSSEESLDIQATIECGFTLKRVRDMIKTYSEMHRTDKYSKHTQLNHLASLAEWLSVRIFCFFFYLGFLSQPITNHRPAGEGGRHFFNSSLALPPVSQTLRH